MPPRRARFGADLLANFWQMHIFANTHGTKIFREVAGNTEKGKKIPAPSNESAGILGAASRNRTGTVSLPGDFKFSDGGEKCIILSSKHGYKCNIFCKM